MGNKENKVEKAVLDNKVNKYGATKKTYYSLLSMVVCLALIVVLSVTQATFNKDSLLTTEFWIDFAILGGLCIFGMVTGQQSGDDIARNNPTGSFRTSLKKYSASFKKNDELSLFAYFDDWLELFRIKRLQKKKEYFLKDNGINQMEVLDLDINDLDKLTHPFKKVWKQTIYEGKYKDDTTYFLSYTKEQIEVIRFCLLGKVKVSRLPRSFFVDALNQSEKDMWESAAKSSKKKSSYLGVNYTYKIVALLVMSILSAGLVPGINDDVSSAVIWLSLMKRVFCVVTSYLWGMYIGFEIVKIDISYLDFKTDVLNQFYEENHLGLYVHKSIEQMAKESYIEMEENSDGKEREKNILDQV